MTAAQVVSKQRVRDFGEVYTNPREVNAMLDLVKDEAARIESTFLEPAAGNGNFLVAILERKLATAERLHGGTAEYEAKALQALTTIYGIDILADNVAEARCRLLADFWNAYWWQCPRPRNDAVVAAAGIVGENIQQGDFLTATRADGSPVTFLQWTLLKDCTFETRPCRLDHMLKAPQGIQGRLDL